MRNELLPLTLSVPDAMKYWRHETVLAGKAPLNVVDDYKIVALALDI